MTVELKSDESAQRTYIGPAPVLELAYAFFRVVAPDNPRATTMLPWLRQLEATAPTWLTEARSAFADSTWTGYETLLTVCALGYALDDSPERLFQDLAGLPAVMAADLDKLNVGGEERPPSPASPQGKMRKRLRTNFELLATSGFTSTLESSLRGLWTALEPDWTREGRALAEEVSEQLHRAAGNGGDVLEALPPHHFVSLETSVRDIRHRGERVRLVVAPLYFAAMGGFKFEIGNALYLGFGLRSERLHQERHEHVADLASRLKAFADPTRLMLLALISRLRRFPLTVGDLARQLGVSQPTASGHLKLLRDLDLVEVVKRGNRSYYRVREAPLNAMLRDLEETLLLTRKPSKEDDESDA